VYIFCFVFFAAVRDKLLKKTPHSPLPLVRGRPNQQSRLEPQGGRFSVGVKCWPLSVLREQAAQLDDEVNRQLDSLFRRSVEYQPPAALDETARPAASLDSQPALCSAFQSCDTYFRSDGVVDDVTR
jgi:hypothetical protein